jgi:PST family polysaccharide transporter
VSDAVYPYISKLAGRSREEALRFICKLILIIGGETLLLSAMILFPAPYIAGLIFGSSYSQSIPVLRIMAFVPFLAAMSTLLGTQTMLTFDLKKEFSRILVSAGAVNIVLTFILAGRYQHIGVALSVLFTEALVVSMMYVYLRAKNTATFGRWSGRGIYTSPRYTTPTRKGLPASPTVACSTQRKSL